MEKYRDYENERINKILACLPSKYTNEEKTKIAILLIDLAEIYLNSIFFENLKK